MNRAQIEQLIADSRATIARIEQAGRSVPEWAIDEVRLAQNVLDAYARGDDPAPAQGVLQTFLSGNEAEKSAFLSDPTLRI